MQSFNTESAHTAVTHVPNTAANGSPSQVIPVADLRRRILKDLPSTTFKPRPLRALWFIPLLSVAAASMTLVIVVQPIWYLSIVLAFVIGQCIASMGFLAHEVLHGSMVSSTKLQTVLGYIGFGPLGISPTLWRVWHNQIHHGKTNMGNADPDSFGTLERYRGMPSTRFVARLAPGSRHWSSAFFMAYWLSFHAQIVLWIQSRYMLSFAGLDRQRAKFDTLGSAAFWLSIAILSGWTSIYVIVIPLIVANATMMSYIATNHFMRGQSDSNDPLENSMSVTTLRLIDRIHFNYSHHVEHHLFPRMSPAHAPAVRAWLLSNTPDRYVTPPHYVAVAALYRTPRIFLDATTLCDPEDLGYTADTGKLATGFGSKGA